MCIKSNVCTHLDSFITSINTTVLHSRITVIITTIIVCTELINILKVSRKRLNPANVNRSREEFLKLPLSHKIYAFLREKKIQVISTFNNN